MDYIKTCLSRLIGEQKANELYEKVGDPLSISQCSVRDMQAVGISKRLATKVKQLFEFKSAAYEVEKLPQVTQSSDVADIMTDLSSLDHEQFWVIYLTQSNRVKKKERISTGGVAGTVVDVKMIMRYALLNKCSAIILVHNHPSGNLSASKADIEITKKIKEAGRYMDISVLDHIIIAGDSYTSMADEGLM